jgi:transposase
MRSCENSSLAEDVHAPVEVTWLVYQQITTAYAHPDPREGQTLLASVIDALRTAAPAGLDELATLGRTLQRRRDDVLAHPPGIQRAHRGHQRPPRSPMPRSVSGSRL